MQVNIGIRRISKIVFETGGGKGDSAPKLLIDGDEHPTKVPLKDKADYQFATTIYGTHLKYQDMNEIKEDSKNSKANEEFKGKDDKRNKYNYGYTPFAVEFSWDFVLNGSTIYHGEQVWNLYHIDGKNDNGDKEWYTVEYVNNKATEYDKYIKLVNFGVNSRKYVKGNDETEVCNQPLINFRLTGDFPKNAKFEVTARALYAYGSEYLEEKYEGKSGYDWWKDDWQRPGYADGNNYIAKACIESDSSSKSIIIRGTETEVNMDPVAKANIEAKVPNELKNELNNNGKWFWCATDKTTNEEFGWRKCVGSNYTEMRLTGPETLTFLPSHEYKIELGLFIFEESNGMGDLCWPHSQEIANQIGRGLSKKEYSSEGYSVTYDLGKSFVKYKDGQNEIDNYYSADAPYKTNGKSNIEVGIMNIANDYHYGNLKAVLDGVEKFNGSTWEKVNNLVSSVDYQDKSDSLKFFPNAFDKLEGGVTYRAFLSMDGSNITEWNKDVWNPQYNTVSESRLEPLYSGTYVKQADGSFVYIRDGKKGYVYFTIDK